MGKWLLRQLNVTNSNEFVEHLDEVSLGFHHDTWLWVGLLLIGPLAWFVYRRQVLNLPTVPSWVRFTLTATRVLILALLCIVLAGPYLKLEHNSEKKPIVGLLFDYSQSMRLPSGPFDSEDELTRTAEAAGYRAVEGRVDPEARKSVERIPRSKLAQTVIQAGVGATWLTELNKKFEVRFYGFSKEIAQLAVNPLSPKMEEPPDPGGSSTHIGDAVTHVLEEAAGRLVAGVVIFSDGQNTGGRSPADASLLAAGAGTPIFSVPVGSTTRLKDVAIVDLFSNNIVSLGDIARVNVTLESHGFDRRATKVELKEGDKVLDSKEILLNSNEQQQVELTFKAEKAGHRNLTVSVPPQPEEEEHLRGNNVDTALVRVSEEKMKVLYIDGLPRWDFRYIKNAIRRDHGLGGRTSKEPDIVIETEWRRLKTPAEKKAALPRTLEQLAEYHTVILGDVSPAVLDKEFIDLLDKAVREKGVGLIVEPGPLSMPHRFDDKLLDLLPVKLKKEKNELMAGVYPRGEGSFRIELAPEGSIHEAMRFYDEPGRNQNAWANLPRYFWSAAVERPAAGATVLAWNPSKTLGKLPLIAQHYAGKGKVIFVGTDSTWLWRQNVGDRFFYKFWGQGIRYVARRDASTEKKSSIETRPARIQPGEPAQVELMAFGDDGAPKIEPTQSIQVQGGSQPQAIVMTADPAMKGRFFGKYTPEKAGDYRLTYTPGGKADAVESRIRAAVAPEEMRQPNVNRVALEQLASASGGKLVELPDLKGITEYLQGESKFTKLDREASLWDNGMFLGILVFLYSLDVGLRRLLGLS